MLGFGNKGEGNDDEIGDADGAKEAAYSPNDPSHSGIPLINDIDSSQIVVEYVDTNTDIESYIRMIDEECEKFPIKVESSDVGIVAVNSMPLNHRNIKEEYLPSSMSHVDIESEDDLNIVYEDLVTVRPNVYNIKKEPYEEEVDNAGVTCVAISKNLQQVKIDDDLEVVYLKVQKEKHGIDQMNIKKERHENEINIKEEVDISPLMSLANTPVNRKKILHTPPSIGPVGAVPKKRLTFDGGNLSSVSSAASEREHIAAIEENTSVMRELINVLKRMACESF